jgi:uncharacterized membrane protein
VETLNKETVDAVEHKKKDRLNPAYKVVVIAGMSFIISLFLEALITLLLPILYMQTHDIPTKKELAEDMGFGMLVFFSFYLSLPIVGVLSFLLGFL